MPGVLRTSLERMMPRLRAQEELDLASAVAAGTGSLEKRVQRKWLKDRKDAATGKRHVQRAASWDEHFANLRARGFNVVIDGEVMR